MEIKTDAVDRDTNSPLDLEFIKRKDGLNNIRNERMLAAFLKGIEK